MATNYVQKGKTLWMTTVSGAESGDAFVSGDFLPCVLLSDADSSNEATVVTEGVFDLSCKAHDGSQNSKIEIGDALYWTDKDTVLDKDSSQKFFGVALEEVTSGETETINVFITPKMAVPGSVGTSDLEAGAVVEAKIGAGAVVEAKLGANAVTNDKIATDVIQVAEVAVSNAELLALNATPKTLVAAPGENNLLEFISAVCHYNYDTTAFTPGSATDLQVKYTDGSGTAVSATRAVTGFLDQASDETYYIPPVGTSAVDVNGGINEPLVLTLAAAEMSDGGSSTMTVRIAYRVHDLS